MPIRLSEPGVSDDGLPFRPVADGLRVTLRVTPKASANRIAGMAVDAEGAPALKVGVTAPPDKGKANTAVVRLLAKEWGLPKSDMEIILGETSRSKSLLIRGDGMVLMQRLRQWCLEKGHE